MDEPDIRDFFAGMAVQGLLTQYSPSEKDIREVIANNAYAMADAMLAERRRLKELQEAADAPVS
jgi:hypothetical protein